MAEHGFVERSVEIRRMHVAYRVAGEGEIVLSIAEDGVPALPSDDHLAAHRRVVAIRVPRDPATAKAEAQRVAAAMEALGFDRFDMMGHGAGAAVALWLACDNAARVGSIVLASPEGTLDASMRDMKRPVLALFGTRDGTVPPEQIRAYGAGLPDCHLMYVYDAGRAIGTERPEALAFIAREFFDRRDLFLVSRESGMSLP